MDNSKFERNPELGIPFTNNIWITYYSDYVEPIGGKTKGYWNMISNKKIIPALGFYSSSNLSIIKKHFDMMTEAKIDAIIVPFFNGHKKANTTHEWRQNPDALGKIVHVARNYDIKVGFMIPDYDKRKWKTIIGDIRDLYDSYSRSTSILRFMHRPVIFIENAGKLKDSEMKIQKIRRTYLDCFIIGHAQTMYEYRKLILGGYDGIAPLNNENAKFIYENPYLTGEVNNFAAWAGCTLVSIAHLYERNTDGEGCKKLYESLSNASALSNTILIHSFNGWFDGSNIEPAILDSNSLLNIGSPCAGENLTYNEIIANWKQKNISSISPNK